MTFKWLKVKFEQNLLKNGRSHDAKINDQNMIRTFCFSMNG